MQLAATRKGGGKRCSGRPQLTELNTGFSRASRSPATRRLAKLAPRASARKQHSADRSRACELTTYALPERSERCLRSSESGDNRSDDPPCREAAARATLQVAKNNLQKKRLQTTANEQRFSLPTTSLRRQRTAESTNHTDKSRNPCHSGCEVAGSEDSAR